MRGDVRAILEDGLMLINLINRSRDVVEARPLLNRAQLELRQLGDDLLNLPAEEPEADEEE